MPLRKPQAVVFDVNETLFSLEPLQRRMSAAGLPDNCLQARARSLRAVALRGCFVRQLPTSSSVRRRTVQAPLTHRGHVRCAAVVCTGAAGRDLPVGHRQLCALQGGGRLPPALAAEGRGRHRRARRQGGRSPRRVPPALAPADVHQPPGSKRLCDSASLRRHCYHKACPAGAS